MTPEEEIITQACLSKAFKDGVNLGICIGIISSLIGLSIAYYFK